MIPGPGTTRLFLGLWMTLATGTSTVVQMHLLRVVKARGARPEVRHGKGWRGRGGESKYCIHTSVSMSVCVYGIPWHLADPYQRFSFFLSVSLSNPSPSSGVSTAWPSVVYNIITLGPG